LPLLKHTIDSAINVDTDIPPGILNVEADPAQMQMVLSAVLTNASEALEGKGRIRIACKNEQITDDTAENHPGLKPGNYACLTVSDNGKGMDEETRDRIFEPFFTTKFEGRGLGMAAAYGIVKNHDGWISVDSELGRGTVVKICLPVVEISAEKRAKSKTELIKGTGTILVIEDEKPIMDVTRSILERLGYHVLEAETGQMAINVVQSFDGVIDLALLDILLPDMSGDTIYPLLMEARPNLKVIVFSGYAKEGPIQKLLDEGAQDFIEKPFKIAELSQKLKKALKGKQ
jgi:CheY-like chemotaxis protein